MSTALSHLGNTRNPQLWSGASDEDSVFDFAKLLEEMHGPPRAPKEGKKNEKANLSTDRTQDKQL